MDVKKENKKEITVNIFARVIVFIIIISFIGLIVYSKYTPYLQTLKSSFGDNSWGYYAAVLSILCLFIALSLFEFKSSEVRNNRARLFIFAILTIALSVYFILQLQIQSDFQNILIVIGGSAVFGYLAAFADSVIAKFIARVGKWTIHKSIRLVFEFFIPMMFVLLVFLGAMQAKYQYQDTFMNDAHIALADDGLKLGNAFSHLVESTYTLGQQDPERWIWLCGGATLFLFLLAIFKREEDENISAQEIIESTTEKDLSEEDIQDIKMLLKGKMRASIVKEMREKQNKDNKKNHNQHKREVQK